MTGEERWSPGDEPEDGETVAPPGEKADPSTDVGHVQSRVLNTHVLLGEGTATEGSVYRMFYTFVLLPQRSSMLSRIIPTSSSSSRLPVGS